MLVSLCVFTKLFIAQQNSLNLGRCSSGVTRGKMIFSADTLKKCGHMLHHLLPVHLTPVSGGIGRAFSPAEIELVFDEVEFSGVHSDRLYAM